MCAVSGAKARVEMNCGGGDTAPDMCEPISAMSDKTTFDTTHEGIKKQVMDQSATPILSPVYYYLSF
jgi:hypothetical protein